MKTDGVKHSCCSSRNDTPPIDTHAEFQKWNEKRARFLEETKYDSLREVVRGSARATKHVRRIDFRKRKRRVVQGTSPPMKARERKSSKPRGNHFEAEQLCCSRNAASACLPHPARTSSPFLCSTAFLRRKARRPAPHKP